MKKTSVQIRRSLLGAAIFSLMTHSAAYASEAEPAHSAVAVTENPVSLVNDPGTHGFVMMGTKELYLNHFAMFGVKEHRYQLILRASLPDFAMQAYLKDKELHPQDMYAVGNVQFDKMTLLQMKTGQVTSFVADIWRGMPEVPNCTPPMMHNVKVDIEEVVYFRQFDDSLPAPEQLTYIVYGSGDEVHMTHYMSRRPDFQQVMDVQGLPAWIPPLQLRSGFHINIPNIPNSPADNVAYTESPLQEGKTYQVHFQGQKTAYPLQPGNTYWFDGAHLNVEHEHHGGGKYTVCDENHQPIH